MVTFAIIVFDQILNCKSFHYTLDLQQFLSFQLFDAFVHNVHGSDPIPYNMIQQNGDVYECQSIPGCDVTVYSNMPSRHESSRIEDVSELCASYVNNSL